MTVTNERFGIFEWYGVRLTAMSPPGAATVPASHCACDSIGGPSTAPSHDLGDGDIIWMVVDMDYNDPTAGPADQGHGGKREGFLERHVGRGD